MRKCKKNIFRRGRVVPDFPVDGHIYICMYMYVCIYVCIYICMYVYVCMYICMYIYVCMQRERDSRDVALEYSI